MLVTNVLGLPELSGVFAFVVVAGGIWFATLSGALDK